MKQEILTHLADPVELEKLYRSNRNAFSKAFRELYPEIKHNALVSFWHERLHTTKDDISWGSPKDLLFVIVSAVIAGTVAKFPAIFGLNEEHFYSRNIGFILFPFLAAFFAYREMRKGEQRVPAGKFLFVTGLMLAALLFINLTPGDDKSDTLQLSCIHLPLFLWSLTGFVFAGGINQPEKRIGYLRYNGDLLVICALMLIAGGILSGVTVGLFSLIGFNIEKFYFNNIVVFSLPAVPLIGTYLIRANPQLVGKVSPVIARIFAPVVMGMLLIYLGAIIYSGKDPYNDREFLLLFNLLLVGVMAIIFFSIAGSSNEVKSKWELWILFLLSILTIVVNGIALSAIWFRIAEWGITPNRAAVLGGNVIILVNLLLVTSRLYGAVSGKTGIAEVEKIMGKYLPVYFVWAGVVAFLFPVLFGFK